MAETYKVLVKNDYRGRLVEHKLVVAGEYDSDDPVLCGAAEYLVKHGYANVVGEVAPAKKRASKKAEEK